MQQFIYHTKSAKYFVQYTAIIRLSKITKTKTEYFPFVLVDKLLMAIY